MNNQQHITVFGKKTELKNLDKFLSQYIRTHKLPAKLLHDLKLVLEETFINIVTYAYNNINEEEQTVCIEICHKNNCISLYFTDTGVAFNPLEDVHLSEKPSNYGNGGMGIQLIKLLTDEQYYKRTNQTNVFTLVKYYT